MVYTKNKTVRFAYCDPAGIVFYPRYLELSNEVVEDWFRECLHADFHTLHETMRLGIPAVRLNVEFLAPSVYGDMLEFSLQVEELGNSSILLALVARCGEQERIRVQIKIVMMDMDTHRPVKIDAVWRARFSAFLAQPLALVHQEIQP